MGKFDEQIAHGREKLELEREFLEDLQSGKKTMGEDNGQGYIDMTGSWIVKTKYSVEMLETLINALEKNNT